MFWPFMSMMFSPSIFEFSEMKSLHFSLKISTIFFFFSLKNSSSFGSSSSSLEIFSSRMEMISLGRAKQEASIEVAPMATETLDDDLITVSLHGTKGSETEKSTFAKKFLSSSTQN